jgi:hypothetical protein
MPPTATKIKVILYFHGVLLFVGIGGAIGFAGFGDGFHVLLLQVHGNRDIWRGENAGTDVGLQLRPKRRVLLNRAPSFGHVVGLIVHRAVNSKNYF